MCYHNFYFRKYQQQMYLEILKTFIAFSLE